VTPASRLHPSTSYFLDKSLTATLDPLAQKRDLRLVVGLGKFPAFATPQSAITAVAERLFRVGKKRRVGVLVGMVDGRVCVYVRARVIS